MKINTIKSTVSMVILRLTHHPIRVNSRSWFRALCAALLVTNTSSSATAGIITLGVGTGTPAIWAITGAGASNAPVYGFADAGIGITSNGNRTGTFVAGGSLANFDGFWYAETSFFLPANATNVSLDFSGLGADDRVVLELNGQIVGNFFLNASGEGVMTLSPGTNSPFTFTNQRSGTVNTGFLLGQENHLRLVVNNTDWNNPYATTKTFNDDIDGTAAYLAATVTYTVPDPPLPGVSIATYAGLTIDGAVGQTYGIQATTDLSNANGWAGVANVTLTQPTQIWYDSQSTAQQPKRFYRVVAGPISIP